MPSQQQIKWSQLRVGITVLVASVTLAVLIFFMSGTVSPFSHKIIIKAYFENAAGLVKGAPVSLSGVNIGNVDRIGIVPGKPLTPVEVDMKVGTHYIRDLHKDSKATLATQGVLGATFVDIDSSHATGPQAQDGDVLPTTETPALQDVMKATQGTIQKLNALLDQASDIVADIQNGEGSVGKLLEDPQLYNRMNSTVAELQKVTEQISGGKGSIGKLIYSDDMYNKIDDTVTRLNKLVGEIDSGQGSIGKFIKDPTLYNNANQTIAKANQLMTDINAGHGVLGKLAKDEEYAKKLDRITTNLETISNQLAAGQGSAGRLLRDPSLYNNANDVMAESRNLIKAIRQNPKKYLTIHLKIF